MDTRLAADRRIRAAALGRVGLDIRGPVSQALARAGVALPLADVPPDSTPAATHEAPSPPRTPAAERVVKPFEETPWPTRARPADPLSGLTADERRVHRILLDHLELIGQNGYGSAGLGYAERQKLSALDLAFIDAEIARMEAHGGGRGQAITVWVLAACGTLLMTLGLTTSGPSLIVAVGAVLTLVAVAIATGLLPTDTNRGVAARAATPRRKIYDALRELALLVDDAPVSDALATADALIDRMAGADPLLRLDDAPAPTASGAPRARVRS